MTQITKQLMCIQMRTGIQLWIEAERVKQLQSLLEKITASKFIHFDDQTINTADIVGIFTAQTMEDHTRRGNGQWRCKFTAWHDKGEKCGCTDPVTDKEWEVYRTQYYAEHGFYPLRK